jgi:hypothetical protein
MQEVIGCNYEKYCRDAVILDLFRCCCVVVLCPARVLIKRRAILYMCFHHRPRPAQSAYTRCPRIVDTLSPRAIMTAFMTLHDSPPQQHFHSVVFNLVN